MGARAESQPSRAGGIFSSAVSTLISLSLSLTVSAGSHTTHQLHTPHTAHTPGSRQAARLSARRSRPSVPGPPRALCAVTRTHALASTLSLSPSYSKTQKTRVGIREGERQSACADATRPPPPEPHVGAHPGPHRSWGAGRGPADAWPGVWRVACRSRAERGVHSARAEVRRVRARHSWPSRKPPLYKF